MLWHITSPDIYSDSFIQTKLYPTKVCFAGLSIKFIFVLLIVWGVPCLNSLAKLGQFVSDAMSVVATLHMTMAHDGQSSKGGWIDYGGAAAIIVNVDHLLREGATVKRCPSSSGSKLGKLDMTVEPECNLSELWIWRKFLKWWQSITSLHDKSSL